MKNLALPSTLLLCIALASVGCDRDMSCTQIGCGPSISIRLNKADGWDQTNRVKITHEGVAQTCVVEMDASVTCDSFAGQVQGTSLDIYGQTVRSGAPNAFAFEVYQNEDLVEQKEAMFSYTSNTPNGPNCGPLCERYAYEGSVAPSDTHVGVSDMDSDMLQTEADMPLTEADMPRDMTDFSSPISCLDGEYMCEPAPLTPGKYCCPRTGPSCDCSYTGGTLGPFGACENVCDAVPTGWTTTVDENGCTVDIPGPESCLVPPEDMGSDM